MQGFPEGGVRPFADSRGVLLNVTRNVTRCERLPSVTRQNLSENSSSHSPRRLSRLTSGISRGRMMPMCCPLHAMLDAQCHREGLLSSRRPLVDDLARSNGVSNISECLRILAWIGAEDDDITVHSWFELSLPIAFVEPTCWTRRQRGKDLSPGESSLG